MFLCNVLENYKRRYETRFKMSIKMRNISKIFELYEHLFTLKYKNMFMPGYYFVL